MTNKRKKRTRALAKKTGMSYQAASNALGKNETKATSRLRIEYLPDGAIPLYDVGYISIRVFDSTWRSSKGDPSIFAPLTTVLLEPSHKDHHKGILSLSEILTESLVPEGWTLTVAVKMAEALPDAEAIIAGFFIAPLEISGNPKYTKYPDIEEHNFTRSTAAMNIIKASIRDRKPYSEQRTVTPVYNEDRTRVVELIPGPIECIAPPYTKEFNPTLEEDFPFETQVFNSESAYNAALAVAKHVIGSDKSYFVLPLDEPLEGKVGTGIWRSFCDGKPWVPGRRVPEAKDPLSPTEKMAWYSWEPFGTITGRSKTTINVRFRGEDQLTVDFEHAGVALRDKLSTIQEIETLLNKFASSPTLVKADNPKQLRLGFVYYEDALAHELVIPLSLAKVHLTPIRVQGKTFSEWRNGVPSLSQLVQTPTV